LALLTTLVVISSFFVIAGAQVASAQTCADATAICHLAFRFDGTDSSPRRAAVGETITSADLDPSGPPVIVEVEFESGLRDTSYGGQITVALVAGTGLSGKGFGEPGARQACPCTVTAVNGAASFDLSIDTKGKDFQLTATASPETIAPITSGTFRIEGDRCAGGETCTDSLPKATTLSPAPSQTWMIASLTNGGTGVVALSVGVDGVDPLLGGTLTSCSTDTFKDPWFHAPAETTVDEVRATGSGTKVVVLRIKKEWRQMVVDKGSSSYRGCVTAQLTPEQAAAITTWNKSPITQTSPGQWTFLVPDCTKTITTFCRAFVKSNKAGDVLEGLAFPSGNENVFGDPRGH
jgi:hypothetical protein